MLRRIALIFCCSATFLGIAACDQSGGLIESAKKSIARNLKDPESARFDQLVPTTNSKGEKGVCGLVNAKNAMGGYVGFQPFASDGQEALITSAEDLERHDAAVGFLSDKFTPHYFNEVYPAELRKFHLVGCAGEAREKQARIFDEIIRECLGNDNGSNWFKCAPDRWASRKDEYNSLSQSK